MSPGRLLELWRYPVKSMAGGRLEEARLTPAGIPGDRGWALVDRATGKPLSAKRHARLMLCRARYLDEPGEGPLPPAEAELPDGTRARSDDPGAGALLSRWLGLDCAFSRAASGGFFDGSPLHILTDASLREMGRRTGLAFDARRFRANLVLSWPGEGFPESAWGGRTLEIGGARISVAQATKRCVMTTLPQPGLAWEKEILPALVREATARLGVYGAAAGAARVIPGDAAKVAP